MNNKLEQFEVYFDKRYKQKKRLNMCLSVVIIGLCLFSLVYMQNNDKEGLLIFRWMTVDATVFTLFSTLFFFVVNIIELMKNTELTRKTIYISRLSCAVAESLIMVTVLVSQLPIFPMHLHILRPDMFCMHLVIPVLVVLSFTLNDSPYGRLNRFDTFRGTSFVTFYAVIILYLISVGVIKREKIPYGFLDIKAMNSFQIIATIIVFYIVSYGLSHILSEMNRKLYWNWFKRPETTKKN